MMTRLSPLLLFLVFAVFLIGSVVGTFRVCENSSQRQVAGPGANQVQVVYNSKRHEYFAVYLLLENDLSSIMGQRYDERGATLGHPVPIHTRNDTIRTKQFPVVAYNNNSDLYLVAWEFDWKGDGSDWDVMARVVNTDGSEHSPAFFVGYSFGRDDSPHLAFSYKDNSYVLVHEVEDSLSGFRGIAAVRMNETHTLGPRITFNTSYSDHEPFIAYHPPTNNFVIVWEWDDDKDNKSVIGAVLVTGTPLRSPNKRPNIVGSTVELIGTNVTIAHDHDAQLTYSPQDNHFLLTWEVDGDSGEKEVVASRINPDATAKRGFTVVGHKDLPFDRRPSVVYSAFSNDFLVTFESGTDPIATTIAAVALSSTNMSILTRFRVSQALDREHAPATAISTNCGSVLALWASDTSLTTRSRRSNTRAKSTFAPAPAKSVRRREESGAMTSSVYKPYNKFVGAAGGEKAVPHVYFSAERMPWHASKQSSKRIPSDMSYLEAIQVCLPGRGSCSAGGSPLPAVSPSPKPPSSHDDNGGGSAMVIVLGLLGAVLGLTGLGVLGFFIWRRSPQIREWIESRRARGFEGVWADESEFSISVDAFTGADDDASGEASS